MSASPNHQIGRSTPLVTRAILVMSGSFEDQVLVNLVVIDVYANPEIPFVKLKGLRENAWYQLERTGQLFLGLALMYGGYSFTAVSEDYPCEQLYFKRMVHEEL